MNQEFTHADAEGIDILLINNGVHVDLILPIDEDEFSWRDHLMPVDFPAFDARYQYAVFGWGLIPIPNAHYHQRDAFYEATGRYHLFRTCNVWVGNALAHSGVRVGYWTLTPDLLFACLPPPPKNLE